MYIQESIHDMDICWNSAELNWSWHVRFPQNEADTSLSYSHCSCQWIVFVTISCKNRLINKKHPSNFPKYLPLPVRPLKLGIAATGIRTNLSSDAGPGLLLLHVAVTLASVVFRFEEPWVLTLSPTQLPLTQASDTPLLSLQHLYCLEGCNYPTGGLPQILQHYETFYLSSHFILYCDRVWEVF